MKIAEFFVAALLLELTPGPNMAYLATLSLSRGRMAGLIATAGVACGLAVHAVVAAFGVGALIEQSRLLYETLRWIGVAYLLYLAWEAWQPTKEVSPERADFIDDAGPLFLRGFLSNVFNPKSVLFFVSVVPGFLQQLSDAYSASLQIALLGAIYVSTATFVHATIVLLAARLEPWLMQGRRHDITRRILAVVLALIAVWLAWTTRR